MSKSTAFQRNCEKSISALTEEDVEKFKQITSDDERIRMLYKCGQKFPITVVSNSKSYNLAQEAKTQGNQFFAGKNYTEALKSYNKGIITCPQDTDAGKELLAILIANRSATFYELKQHRKVFDDIDYVLSVGSYPLKLQYKIWLRKAKCYEAIQNLKYAEETYSLAISSLTKHSQLDPSALKVKINEILQAKAKKEPATEKYNELLPTFQSERFLGGNAEFVAAHKDIFFDYDPLLGRFARAVDHIKTGEIVVEENPHCAVISSENCLLNCQFCAISTKQPIACPKCANVIFCSLNCERKSNISFHKFECMVQPTLFESGASINCSMALRMISQKPHGFFQEKKKLLKDFLKDNCKKPVVKTPIYRSDDYIAAFFLCRNELHRKKGELVHYSIMAIFLVRLLKLSGYFGSQVQDEVVTEEEVFIAGLLLRHLQILQFNSHEISELRNVPGADSNYKNEYIGAGLYPTLALFNHSCDPSVIRYNIGNKMLARTIKPLSPGDVIYENYGPIYTTMGVDARRANLQERYWFDCYCPPCQNDWPLFQQMDDNIIKIGCQSQNCPFEFSLQKDDFCPYIKCDYCETVTKIFPILRGLSQLAGLLPQAELFFSEQRSQDAQNAFTQALDILYKYSKPPCPDMVKVQQRLRTLFVHLGNRQIDYVENL